MAKPMTKSAIADHLAKKAGLTKKAAVGLLDEIAALAHKEAKNTFTLPGIGKLVLVNRKARMGRNPPPASQSRSRPRRSSSSASPRPARTPFSRRSSAKGLLERRRAPRVVQGALLRSSPRFICPFTPSSLSPARGGEGQGGGADSPKNSSTSSIRVVKGQGGRAFRKIRPYDLVARRRSRTTSTPLSSVERISLPSPCRRAITACGTW